MPEDFFCGNIPAASGNQVYLERPRINRLLEKAVEKPITCVVAGAGYGKTMAVYAFAKEASIRTAWIQLSEQNNVGGHFWKNFASAISIVSKNMAQKMKDLDFPATEQQFEQYLEIPRQDIIPNEKFLVVYDDVQLITDHTVLRFLEHRITVSSPNISSVLISRTEPPLNMAKMESKNMLARITEEELRFSQDEMVSYFRLRNVSPAPRLVSAIYHDTEGWPFAIHLAGLSLRNVPSGTAHVPLLLKSSTSRLIESEIMSSLSPELQRFLIKLSLIENLNPLLVQEIGKDPSLIKEMEGIGSFIRFDRRLNSYRIHHFFMNYLREKQDELSDEEKKDVWTKTALWCAANNRKMNAIVCYEKTGDYNGIFNILSTLPMILPGQMARLILDILDRAPRTIYRNYPETIVMRSRTLCSLRRFQESRAGILEAITDIKDLPESSRKHRILMACYINLGFIGVIQSIYTKQYDFIDFFREGVIESRLAEYVSRPPLNGITLSSYACRVMAPASKEDIEKYIEMIGKIAPHAQQALGGCIAGVHELCRGEYAFYRGELEEAEKLLLASLAKAREKQQYEVENRSRFYLLRIYLSRGDAKGIEKTLRQLEAELEEPLSLNRHFYHDIVTGWYYIQTGRKDRIAPWLKSDYEESKLCYGALGLERLVKAKYYLAEKRYPAALAVMENRENVEPIFIGNIEMKALEAVCRYRSLDREGAYKALEEAYDLASPAGFFMPFAELGKDMRALLETARKQTAAGDKAAGLSLQWLEETHRKAAVYAKKLYPQTERASATAGHGKGPPLSHRETEVLIGLSQGLTREEIAGAASISPNTVKSAVRSIYNKLGALNQADAVRIATEKGILS